MNDAPLRTLIVEDVALAQAALKRLLAAHGDIEVAGVAASIGAARALIAAERFDLALLDVRLPDGSGVDLAREWPEPRPPIVFITATPDAAADAFALDADDYVLKPIAREGVDRALARVRRRRALLVADAGATPAAPARRSIEIRDAGRTLWLDAALVDFVDVAGHYLCLHAGRDIHLLRRPIADLASELGSGFARIHRSAIVRLDGVRAVVERRNGDADVELASGARLKMSRNYREDFDARMAAGQASAPR